VSYAGVDVTTLLRTGMRVASMNHRVIANNIANVDTPHFNPVEVDFQKTLRAALEGRERVGLRRTDPRHFEATRNLVDFKRLARSSKNDYNKVELDNEMMKLNENTGRFDLYGSLLASRSQRLRDMLANIR
jgi:flagellar basal-body rod protein FlgB